jgi:hypothetical protein
VFNAMDMEPVPVRETVFVMEITLVKTAKYYVFPMELYVVVMEPVKLTIYRN